MEVQYVPVPIKNPEPRARIYYDAEFTGLHRGTTLISIGMYSETTGSYFYGEFSDYDRSQVDEWLQEHVISNLVMSNEEDGYHVYRQSLYDKTPSVMCKGSTEYVGKELISWLDLEHKYADRKIQFYTDCYAYDWMLLNDLICEDGRALNLPDFIDYIPIDLSTIMYFVGVDPDVTREEFASKSRQEALTKVQPFSEMGENIKHNSLWDAVIAYLCFYKIMYPNPNQREYDYSLIQRAMQNLPELQGRLDLRGEKEHPV